jgi:hypothetical protein
MVSSGLLRRVALVRTDVSEEPGASFIRVTKIGALGTTQAATSNRRTLRRNTKSFKCTTLLQLLLNSILEHTVAYMMEAIGAHGSVDGGSYASAGMAASNPEEISVFLIYRILPHILSHWCLISL